METGDIAAFWGQKRGNRGNVDVPSDREGRGSAETVEGSNDELDQRTDLDGDQLCVLWSDRALVWSEQAAELIR